MGRSPPREGKGCGPFLCEKSGGSRRSNLRGSSLRRCSLAGDLGCGLRRGSLACSLGGSAVLLSDSGGSGGLGLSRSSLRGGSSGRRRAAAGSHADSKDQSSNGNSNILEFHMKISSYLKIVLREGRTGKALLQKDILVRFRKNQALFGQRFYLPERFYTFVITFR